VPGPIRTSKPPTAIRARRPQCHVAALYDAARHQLPGWVADFELGLHESQRPSRHRRAVGEVIEKLRRFITGTIVDHDQLPGCVAAYRADVLQAAGLAHAVARGDDDRHARKAGIAAHAGHMGPHF
jgi:hypothetical protein